MVTSASSRLLPEMLDEFRRMREVGVHGQQVVARRARETGDERAAVSRLDLFDHVRAVLAGRLPREDVGVAREQEDLVAEAQPLQDRVQLRQEDREVPTFVERGYQNGQIDRLGARLLAPW